MGALASPTMVVIFNGAQAESKADCISAHRESVPFWVGLSVRLCWRVLMRAVRLSWRVKEEAVGFL